MADRPSTAKSLATALGSWRLGAVALLSFSSGLPLALPLKTVPYWLEREGIDIKTIGLVTAAQAPYAFKFLWSPLMDRFAPRWGRKRGWILFAQLALAALCAALALVANAPSVVVVGLLVLSIAFFSATQDIAVDAYCVEALRPEEQGVAVGARTALYRAAMYVVGGVLVTLGPVWGWQLCFGLLAALFVPLALTTALAPEPKVPAHPPASIREAAFAPLVSFLRRERALEIAAFLFLYKLPDNLAGALVTPFLSQVGFSSVDVGVANSTIGLVATLAGTFIGGLCTTALGVPRALWIFGALQALSNVGYIAVAELGVNRPAMYAAMAVEASTSGLGTGAFGVLLLRLTERRFSATQYALFSSLFALSRTVSGPPAGALVDAVGWSAFFVLTIALAVPGLWMLQRYAPWSMRDLPSLSESQEEGPSTSPMGRWAMTLRASLVGLAAFVFAGLFSAVLTALKAMRAHQAAFDLLSALRAFVAPARGVDYLDWLAAFAFALLAGLSTAAYLAARRGSSGG